MSYVIGFAEQKSEFRSVDNSYKRKQQNPALKL